MPARMDDVMRLCCEVSAHEEIKVAVKNSTKGAMVAGGSAFVGGLLGGPPGIAVEGRKHEQVRVLYSNCRRRRRRSPGSWLTSGQFRPLPQILMELPPPQQRQLYESIVAVLGNLDWTDAAQLVSLVMGNSTLQQQVAATLISYVTKELRAEVRYRD